MENGKTTFAVGDIVDFNQAGRDARLYVPPRPPGTTWSVKGIIHQTSPPAPHPQLIDLGEDYPMGPVSGMFLEKKKVP